MQHLFRTFPPARLFDSTEHSVQTRDVDEVIINNRALNANVSQLKGGVGHINGLSAMAFCYFLSL